MRSAGRRNFPVCFFDGGSPAGTRFYRARVAEDGIPDRGLFNLGWSGLACRVEVGVRCVLLTYSTIQTKVFIRLIPTASRSVCTGSTCVELRSMYLITLL